MKNRRKLYYERIIKNYPSTHPISVLAEILNNMEDITSYYRDRIKYLEQLLRQKKSN